MSPRPQTPPPSPPKAPGKTVTHVHKADLAGEIRKLSPQDGDVLVLPENTTREDVLAFAAALNKAKPGMKVTVIVGDLRLLSLSDMNAAGWYRA